MAESNRMFNLITPFIEEVQKIEDMLSELRSKRWLFTTYSTPDGFAFVKNAEGDQLDGIGQIVDQPRNSMTDNDYYIAIMRKIMFNISCGQPDYLIKYFNLVTEGTVEFYEPFPATIRIVIHNLPSNLSLLTDVAGLKPAGVAINITYNVSNAGSFAFSDEGTFSTPGHGFLEAGYDESHGYIAGKLTEQITIV